MRVFGDFKTTVRRALTEIDPNWESYRGLVVCGSHTPYDVEDAIEAIALARKDGTPALLICYGHQLGAIEYARNVLGIKDATSEEFGHGTFVVKKRDVMKVGLHGGESYWSNYKVAIEFDTPPHFVSVPYHPEYQSSKKTPHTMLVRFLSLCSAV